MWVVYIIFSIILITLGLNRLGLPSDNEVLLGLLQVLIGLLLLIKTIINILKHLDDE